VKLQSFVSHPPSLATAPKIITTHGTLTTPQQLIALQKDQFTLRRAGQKHPVDSPVEQDDTYEDTPTAKLPPNWWLNREQSVLRTLTKPFLR